MKPTGWPVIPSQHYQGNPADRHGQSVRRARAAGKTAPDALARALRKARISQLSTGFLYQHTAALGFTTLPLLPLIR